MVMQYPRQTGLTLDDLISRLNSKTSGDHLPRCLCINEVGVIVLNGEDEGDKGEKTLLSFLDSESDTDRALSFAFLSVSDQLSKKHAIVLAQFPKRIENVPLMPEIERMLSQFSAMAN